MGKTRFLRGVLGGRRSIGTALALVFAFFVVPEPHAQTQGISISERELGDEQTLGVQAGGNSTRPCDEFGEAAGYFSEAATVTLEYQAVDGRMLLIAARTNDDDLTLSVRTPSGAWLCNDDTEGLNPVVSVLRPTSGQYQIWVGTYGERPTQVSATLGFSTFDFPTADAPLARLQLRAGFSPPDAQQVWIGGDVSLASVLPGTGCVGYVGYAPTVRIEYDPAGFRDRALIIQLRAPGPRDVEARSSGPINSTLAVRAPSHDWYCNDDWSYLDPRVTFERPERGYYDVYVGRSDDPARAEVGLELLEIDRPNVDADPHLGRMTLDAAVGRAPLELHAGGMIDASIGITDALRSCVGYISERPHLAIDVPAGATLGLRVSSASDTTLVVSGPGDRWYCDDDGGRAFNPALSIVARERGTYKVFVGNYESVRRRKDHHDHRLMPATLHISRN